MQYPNIFKCLAQTSPSPPLFPGPTTINTFLDSGNPSAIADAQLIKEK